MPISIVAVSIPTGTKSNRFPHKNSIKLNKNEFLLADANFDNRKFFLELAQDQNYKELIKNNKKSKRFSHEEIII